MSEASLVARQVRLKQLAEDIRSCNSRPAGMTVAEWCEGHGITRSAYYWRLKAVRKACIDIVETGRTIAAETSCSPTVDFVELSPIEAASDSKEVSLTIGQGTLILREDISDSFLHRIIEAVCYAG